MDKNFKVIFFISVTCLIWIGFALFTSIQYTVPLTDELKKLGGRTSGNTIQFTHNIGKCTFTGECLQ